jgi:hypothetical protein
VSIFHERLLPARVPPKQPSSFQFRGIHVALSL